MAFFRFTIHLGFNRWNWTESLDWSFPISEIVGAQEYAKKVAISRRSFLVSAASVEAVSVARVNDEGRSFPIGVGGIDYAAGGAGRGAIPIGTSCVSLWQALYVRLYDREGLYAANMHFRGLVPSSVRCAILSADVPLGAESVSENALRNYLLLLTGTNDGVLGRLGFFARSKIVGRGAALDIVESKVDADNRLSIRPSVAAFARGQKVHIHGMNGPGTVGLDGDARITSDVGTVAPDIGFYETSKFLDEACDFAPLPGATVWAIRKVFIPFDRYVIGRTTNRKTGEVKFGTSGKSKSSCP